MRVAVGSAWSCKGGVGGLVKRCGRDEAAVTELSQAFLCFGDIIDARRERTRRAFITHDTTVGQSISRPDQVRSYQPQKSSWRVGISCITLRRTYLGTKEGRGIPRGRTGSPGLEVEEGRQGVCFLVRGFVACIYLLVWCSLRDRTWSIDIPLIAVFSRVRTISRMAERCAMEYLLVSFGFTLITLAADHFIGRTGGFCFLVLFIAHSISLSRRYVTFACADTFKVQAVKTATA